MKVLFFADGSSALGAGHQVRTGVLGRTLQARGHTVQMACRALPGSSDAWAWRDLSSDRWPAEADVDAALRDAASRHTADVIVVDHYSASRDVLRGLSAAARLVTIDDVPDGRFPAGTIVYNPAPGVTPADYPDQIPVLGPAHAVVREEFASPSPPMPREGILVMPGSGDAEWLGPALEALLERTPWPITVITGAYGTSAQIALTRLAASHPGRVAWRSGLAAGELAGLMRGSAAAVLSASTVVFEAAATGLPFVAVLTAGNQSRVAEGLRRRGVPVFEAARAAEIAETLRNPLPATLEVDGAGARRVAARIEESLIATPDLHLRPAVWTDGPRIIEWANDPGSRAGSFTDRRIEPAEHEEWLTRKLMDPEARVFIVDDREGTCGNLRLERNGGEAVVSITVAPERRGQGYGRTMLAALDVWTRSSRFTPTLVAFIREDNAASLALFATAGYAAAGATTSEGHPARRLTRSLAAG